jgi:cytochrome c2
MKWLLLVALVACRAEPPWPTTGGNPEDGRQAIESHGCLACHDIPGARGPQGTVGPSLHGFAQRSYIAGELPNTPSNLIRWVRDPHALRPRTAMPNTNLTAEEARDVAAYLYTLD